MVDGTNSEADAEDEGGAEDEGEPLCCLVPDQMPVTCNSVYFW